MKYEYLAVIRLSTDDAKLGKTIEQRFDKIANQVEDITMFRDDVRYLCIAGPSDAVRESLETVLDMHDRGNDVAIELELDTVPDADPDDETAITISTNATATREDG